MAYLFVGTTRSSSRHWLGRAARAFSAAAERHARQQTDLDLIRFSPHLQRDLGLLDSRFWETRR